MSARKDSEPNPTKNHTTVEPKSERELFAPSNKGLVLDGGASRLSADNSFRNLAVVATTGAGKTSSFILPNLLTLDDCSIVTTDPLL